MDISVVMGLDTTTDLLGSKMATDFTCGNATFWVSGKRLGDASITSTTGFHSGGGNVAFDFSAFSTVSSGDGSGILFIGLLITSGLGSTVEIPSATCSVVEESAPSNSGGGGTLSLDSGSLESTENSLYHLRLGCSATERTFPGDAENEAVLTSDYMLNLMHHQQDRRLSVENSAAIFISCNRRQVN